MLQTLLSHYVLFLFFFFTDTATTEIYTLSLHDALPIAARLRHRRLPRARDARDLPHRDRRPPPAPPRALRERRVRGRAVLAAVALAALGLPWVTPAYHVLLMLPFMAYAVVLLGLNLLF